jgi:hypothetical protein
MTLSTFCLFVCIIYNIKTFVREVKSVNFQVSSNAKRLRRGRKRPLSFAGSRRKESGGKRRQFSASHDKKPSQFAQQRKE